MGYGNLAGDDSKLRESVALLRDRQYLFLKTIEPGNVGRKADRRKQIIPRLGLTIAKSVGSCLSLSFFFFFSKTALEMYHSSRSQAIGS